MVSKRDFFQIILTDLKLLNGVYYILDMACVTDFDIWWIILWIGWLLNDYFTEIKTNLLYPIFLLKPLNR